MSMEMREFRINGWKEVSCSQIREAMKHLYPCTIMRDNIYFDEKLSKSFKLPNIPKDSQGDPIMVEQVFLNIKEKKFFIKFCGFNGPKKNLGTYIDSLKEVSFKEGIDTLIWFIRKENLHEKKLWEQEIFMKIRELLHQ